MTKILPSRRGLRVLIVRVGAMGDVLHGLPAVAALRERMPEAVIGWAVEPMYGPLLDGGGIVDRVHRVPTREWKGRALSVATLRSIAGLRRELIAEEYDVCVDLQGSIRSAVIGRISGAKALFGPREPRERPAWALYRRRVEVKAEHVIEQACELVAAAIGGVELAPGRVTLPIDAAAEAWCDAALAGVGEFCLLSPAAGWGAKQWPAARYRELAERMASGGLAVLVNGGGPADLAVAQAVGAGRIIECSVAELVALTRRAKLVVGGDTGPVHLAAAVGTPVVSLFGPTDPKRNGPDFVGAKTWVLRHETSQLSHARLAETEVGLARIAAEDVMAAAIDLLREDRRDG